MSREHHYLKIIPKYYIAVESGMKPFEVRKNDRDYHVGDILHLQEWTESDGYSGREYSVEVTYLLNDPEYCKEGYVILGIKQNGSQVVYFDASPNFSEVEDNVF